MRLLIIAVLAFLFSPRAASAQGTPYADSRQRFTVRVPEGWTVQDRGDRGAALSGNGLSLLIIPLATSISAREAADNLVHLISSEGIPPATGGEGPAVKSERLLNIREVDRQEAEIADQPSVWILLEATDSSGTPEMVRVMGMIGGGITAGVVISGERSIYFARRGTIEAITATLRLGTNPPIVIGAPGSGGIPSPAVPSPRPTGDETRRSGFEHPRAPANERRPAGRESNRTSPPSRIPASPPTIGLEVRDLTEVDVEELDLVDDSGVLVERLRQGGPADQAGVRQGDVLLQLNGTRLDEAATFNRMLGARRRGDTVLLMVLRNGARRAVSVRVEAP